MPVRYSCTGRKVPARAARASTAQTTAERLIRRPPAACRRNRNCSLCYRCPVDYGRLTVSGILPSPEATSHDDARGGQLMLSSFMLCAPFAKREKIPLMLPFSACALGVVRAYWHCCKHARPGVGDEYLMRFTSSSPKRSLEEMRHDR